MQEVLRKVRHGQNAKMVSPASSTLPLAITSLCLSNETRWEGAGGTGERDLMQVTYLPQLQ